LCAQSPPNRERIGMKHPHRLSVSQEATRTVECGLASTSHQ
jgi:hypothetical protein